MRLGAKHCITGRVRCPNVLVSVLPILSVIGYWRCSGALRVPPTSPLISPFLLNVLSLVSLSCITSFESLHHLCYFVFDLLRLSRKQPSQSCSEDCTTARVQNVKHSSTNCQVKQSFAIQNCYPWKNMNIFRNVKDIFQCATWQHKRSQWLQLKQYLPWWCSFRQAEELHIEQVTNHLKLCVTVVPSAAPALSCQKCHGSMMSILPGSLLRGLCCLGCGCAATPFLHMGKNGASWQNFVLSPLAFGGYTPKS